MKNGIRLLSWLLAGTLFFQSGFVSLATTLEELEQQKNEIIQKQQESQAQLNSVKKQVNSISGAMGTLETDIADLDEEMVVIFTDINLIEQGIDEKEEQIAQTQIEYEAASAEVDRQYESMKIRVKYLYEKGDHTYLDLFFGSTSFGDALTKADYVEKLYEYDRQMLEEYQIAVETKRLWKETLEEEKSELETSKIELEEEQAYLAGVLEEKQKAYDNYEVMLAKAKQEAATYTARINQQTNQIRDLEKKEQQKREEEEAKRKAAEEAARLAAQLEAESLAQQNQEAGQDDQDADEEEDQDNNNGQTDDTSDDSSDRNQSTGSSSSVNESSSDNHSSSSSSGSSSAGGSGKGAQIANFACQFIGNPYVPGGTSLTNGADCSGFTQSVYKNFGISLPRRSADQAAVGTAVSYSEAQPGDLIYYGGHVGIYIGNGQIVHASTQKTGIKISNALYRSIITVRRVT